MIRRLTITFALILLFVLSLSGNALANVLNENQIYNDLGSREAKEEITMLRGLGIISATEGEVNFAPQSVLDKTTLGFWLAKAANLEGHNEAPTAEEYAAEAVENGYLDNTDGMATYNDVVAGILKIIGVEEVTEPAEQAEELGILQGEWHDLVDAGGNATKENTAFIFTMALDVKGPSGKSINDLLGIQQGPSGIVEGVKEEAGAYRLTIGSEEIQFYEEGTISLFNSLSETEGKEVVKSYVKPIGENGNSPINMLVYLEGEGNNEAVPLAGEPGSDEMEEMAQDQPASDESGTEAEAAENTGLTLSTIWTIAIVLLIGIGIGIYVSGRSKTV